MDIEFEVYPVNDGWEAVSRKYLAIINGKDLDDLLHEIRRWVKIRFPGKNARIVLKTRAGQPRAELYVPGPALPIHINPDMFRV